MRRAVLAPCAVLALVAASPAAATPELSVTSRLKDRRSVVTGTRAYVVGTEDGRFPAMGFHSRGEMGGVWTPPLKLLDGVWLSVDGRPVGPARRFASGWGYVRMALPGAPGLQISRTDYVPDGRRGALFGLRLVSTGAARTVTIGLDAHSELMDAYPWGDTTPSQLTANGPDAATFDGRRLVFTDGRRAAAVGAALRPLAGRTGPGFRGPQDPPVICGPQGEGTPDPPARCDDTAYGKGAGGELSWRLRIPARRGRTLWIGVAGSQSGAARARTELAALLRAPDRGLRAEAVRRAGLDRYSRISLPGDRGLQRALVWSKQNLEDARQEALGLRIRDVNEGKALPSPVGRVARIRFFAAGFPDYPWLFATDGEYTAFAAVAAGRFAPVFDHLRALRDVSNVVNRRSGKIAHEVVTDGSVYFGANNDDGNTDESVKYASAVALLWRWSGDPRVLRELYPAARRAMDYVVRTLDDDHDGWPEGAGNVEREGMGQEKLDNAVYTIRGLRDLATLAGAAGDRAVARSAGARAARLARRFTRAWWMPGIPGFADSLGAANAKLFQRHWIGLTPLEAEPPLATRAQAARTLRLRETRCYTGVSGLFHTGKRGCDPAKSKVPDDLQVFTLNTAIAAAAEGNYGRLGRQRRYADASARLALSPDEQPGAMPEIAPSPAYGRSIAKPFVERASVLQTWGTYGTLWPVVHHILGVAPDMGRRRLAVVPQLPPGERRASGSRIRVGAGSIDVAAVRRGRTLVSGVVSRGLGRTRLTLGHVLPAGARIARVTLDGRRARFVVRPTSRGRELVVLTAGRGSHVLRIVLRP